MASGTFSNIASLVATTLLGTVVGMFLGIFKLVAIPAEVVDKLPDAEAIEPKVKYVLKGSPQGGLSYRVKESALLAGSPGEFVFDENELNMWSQRTLDISDIIKKLPQTERDAATPEIMPSAPNLKIIGDTLQISVRLTNAPNTDQARDVVFSTRGRFAIKEGRYTFVADETYLGSARIPHLAMDGLLNQYMYRTYENFAEDYFAKLSEGWSTLGRVEISEGQLILSNES